MPESRTSIEFCQKYNQIGCHTMIKMFSVNTSEQSFFCILVYLLKSEYPTKWEKVTTDAI